MNREAAARAIEAFLRALGRDPGSPELAGTGARVAAAWADELLSGYDVDVDALLGEAVMPGTTALVVVRDLPVTTTCPHHLMVSTGVAAVAIAPHERLVGLGAVARVVDVYARRLALQLPGAAPPPGQAGGDLFLHVFHVLHVNHGAEQN